MYYLGIDIGSTTVKLAVLDERYQLLYSTYERHHSDVRATLTQVIETAAAHFPGKTMTIAITGSGGLLLANWLHVSFVQEVIASKEAVEAFIPQTDACIELGGEDAKIIFFDQSIEQRMNGQCAGGTGAFIDQMATLLDTDATGLNELAKSCKTLYPIASRCGVFAKTDVQPLLNEGARKEDIAASIFQAVVTQTIAGLACGRPIRGYVAFLGGPLQYLSELRKRFIVTLQLDDEHTIVPNNAHLFVAQGCAVAGYMCDEPHLETLDSLLVRLKTLGEQQGSEVQRLPALFETPDDYARFKRRHDAQCVPRGDIAHAKGVLFLGLDAGSTTFKAALIDSDARVLWSFYKSNKGEVIGSAKESLRQLYAAIPQGAFIGHATVTGYGEALLLQALRVDSGEIETVAHLRGAQELLPQVDFILDIGGQDMKCLRIRNGAIDSIMLNEACSSGCGSFIESFAAGLGIPIANFAQTAIEARQPVDLGSRCTVFMNSRVKQAQKEGATVGDIAAGLALAVIKNALFKVIKIRDAHDVGTCGIVQGGTFLNDAVLRAFEQLAQVDAFRPDMAGNMGAYGAALLARDRYRKQCERVSAGAGADASGTAASGAQSAPQPALHPAPRASQPTATQPTSVPVSVFSPAQTHATGTAASASSAIRSTIVSAEEIDSINPTHKTTRCGLCSNNCLLTINSFGRDPLTGKTRRFITGNRCERGAGHSGKNQRSIPNVFAYKNKRLFSYKPLDADDAPRGTVGIPRALNMYENYPFWFTFFTALRFRVELSDNSSKELFSSGIESMPSESVCYPAKMAHGHVMNLLARHPDFIWMPCSKWERQEDAGAGNHYNCPIVASYSEALRLNIDQLNDTDTAFLNPWIPYDKKDYLKERLFIELCQNNSQVVGRHAALPTRAEIDAAVERAWDEDEAFKRDIRMKGQETLMWMQQTGTHGIVLAGRPYHNDPEINHSIPELLTSFGLAVLTEDSVAHLGVLERPIRLVDQWMYHTRLYAAAKVVTQRNDLDLIQLNSFGCGLDALTCDQVQEILEAAGKVYTVLKIDEVSNLGAARIRVRSLLAALRDKQEREQEKHPGTPEEHEQQHTLPSEARLQIVDSFILVPPNDIDAHVSAPAATSAHAVSARVNASSAAQNKASRGAAPAAAPTPAASVALDAPTPSAPNAASVPSSEVSCCKAPVHAYEKADLYVQDFFTQRTSSSTAFKRVQFTQRMREEGWTILAPQMAPIHFEILAEAFHRFGYNVELLPSVDPKATEIGLKYVNNDICYPSILVTGQIMEAVLSGRYDTNKLAVVISQTGGGCRATNYISLIRKALKAAGLSHIPVISLSTAKLGENNPGFKLSSAMLMQAVYAFLYGDVLMQCLYRTRPYEAQKGAAYQLFRRYMELCKSQMRTGLRYMRFVQTCRCIVRDFDALPLINDQSKPRVGVVGEILVKFHPTANNNVVEVIEAQGCEARVPGIVEFFLFGIAGAIFQRKPLGRSRKGEIGSRIALAVLQALRAPVNRALRTSKRFEPPADIYTMGSYASDILSLCNSMGEGWLLTAEMVELIKTGTPNIICAQPFACLPNHVVGKAVIKQLRTLYPLSNIVAIDYDPGSSEVNQLNRIKLMISVAKSNARKKSHH